MTVVPSPRVAPALTQYDVMTLLGPTVLGEPVVVELRYDVRDPLALTLALHSVVGAVEHRSWRLDRRLLDVGTDEPVASDDARVAPVWHPQSGVAVLIELDTPHGVVAVRAELPAVRRFVDRMHAAVAPGTEWDGADLHAEMDALDRELA